MLSLTEDHRLPQLSGKLKTSMVDIVGLSEEKIFGNGEISSGGYTFYWSGLCDGNRLMRVFTAT